MTPVESSPWLSVHVHFDTEPERALQRGDAVIGDVVRPLARSLCAHDAVSRFFFIRYSEGGHHVRFRVQGTANVLRTEGVPAIRRHLGSDGASDGDFDAGDARASVVEPDLDAEGVTETCDHALVSHLRWTPYAREVERYGGADALPLAESHFQDSSQMVLAALETLHPIDQGARMGHGLMTMLLIFHALSDDPADVARFAACHHRMYSPAPDDDASWSRQFERRFGAQEDRLRAQVAQISSAIRGDALPAPYFDAFAEALRATRERAERLSFSSGRVPGYSVSSPIPPGVVTSYAHMTCNRLGVSRPEELFMSYSLTRVLSEAA